MTALKDCLLFAQKIAVSSKAGLIACFINLFNPQLVSANYSKIH
jgi:hypothetical protein